MCHITEFFFCVTLLPAVVPLGSCQLDECHSDEYIFFPLRRTPIGRIPLRRNHLFLKKFKDHRSDHTFKVLIGLNVFMLCLLLSNDKQTRCSMFPTEFSCHTFNV